MLSQTVYGYDATHLKQLIKTNLCSRCDLSLAPFAGLSLQAAELAYADLSGADLRGADLSRANLQYANLAHTKLTGANLSAAQLLGASLIDTDLTQTRLLGADLRQADLSHLNVDLDLEFIELTGVLLEGARFKGGVICATFPEKGGWGCAATNPAAAGKQ